MYIIKKYSASGLYSGEPVESFDTLKEASDYLNKIADKRESEGYDVSDERDKQDNVTWLEITHDNEADAITYRVVFEDNSPKYQCNICGDDDFDSETLLDDHIQEYHVDSDEDSE